MSRDDTGRVSVFLAIAMFGLLAVLGVVVDATGQLRTLLRADNLAAEAARAAGQAVHTGVVRDGDDLAVLEERAAVYATRYLEAAGYGEPGQEWEVRTGSPPGTVHITVSLPYQPRVLGMLGYSERRVVVHTTAVLVPSSPD